MLPHVTALFINKLINKYPKIYSKKNPSSTVTNLDKKVVVDIINKR